MRKIAISTNKGGVLKTSITTNLAGALSGKHKVLIVDTDNQGNCALTFGKNPDDFKTTLYDVIMGKSPAEKAIVKVHQNVYLLPANDDMSFFDFEVLRAPGEHKEPFALLKNALRSIEGKYDFVLIDTPPNLGLMQGNVLTYADEVLIPFQPEAYSMRSLLKILKAIGDFKELNPALTIKGVVATLVDTRTVLHSEILQACRALCMKHGITMYETVIPKSVRFAASIAYDKLPATLNVGKNPAAGAYFDLSKEMGIVG